MVEMIFNEDRRRRGQIPPVPTARWDPSRHRSSVLKNGMEKDTDAFVTKYVNLEDEITELKLRVKELETDLEKDRIF